jgi:hypothetical protein
MRRRLPPWLAADALRRHVCRDAARCCLPPPDASAVSPLRSSYLRLAVFAGDARRFTRDARRAPHQRDTMLPFHAATPSAEALIFSFFFISPRFDAIISRYFRFFRFDIDYFLSIAAISFSIVRWRHDATSHSLITLPIFLRQLSLRHCLSMMPFSLISDMSSAFSDSFYAITPDIAMMPFHFAVIIADTPFSPLILITFSRFSPLMLTLRY